VEGTIAGLTTSGIWGDHFRVDQQAKDTDWILALQIIRPAPTVGDRRNDKWHGPAWLDHYDTRRTRDEREGRGNGAHGWWIRLSEEERRDEQRTAAVQFYASIDDSMRYWVELEQTESTRDFVGVDVTVDRENIRTSPSREPDGDALRTTYETMLQVRDWNDPAVKKARTTKRRKDNRSRPDRSSVATGKKTPRAAVRHVSQNRPMYENHQREEEAERRYANFKKHRTPPPKTNTSGSVLYTRLGGKAQRGLSFEPCVIVCYT
jgi:hypothetical protein